MNVELESKQFLTKVFIWKAYSLPIFDYVWKRFLKNFKNTIQLSYNKISAHHYRSKSYENSAIKN